MRIAGAGDGDVAAFHRGFLTRAVGKYALAGNDGGRRGYSAATGLGRGNTKASVISAASDMPSAAAGIAGTP